MAQGGMMEWIATDPSFAEAYLRGAEGDMTIDRIQLAPFLFAMNSSPCSPGKTFSINTGWGSSKKPGTRR